MKTTKTSRDVLDAALRNRVRQDVDLLPQIASQFVRGESKMKTSIKFIFGAALVLVVFAVSMFSVPGVAQALGKFLGYIPGVGTVPLSGYRLLVKPVSQTKDGTTVSIQQGTIDLERTILTMTVTGSAAQQASMCFLEESKTPQLRLPDGTKMKLFTWVEINPSRTNLRYYFPALPEKINDATLEIPCLLDNPSPAAWEIPLHFGAATDLEPIPVMDVGSTASGTQNWVQAPYRVSITLEQVVPLDDGYLFTGSLKWSSNGLHNIIYVLPSSVEVVDANGQKLIAESVAPDRPDPDSQLTEKQTWSYKVAGKEHAWPLTINFTNVETRYVFNDPATYYSFAFDLGKKPQPGQQWRLNQDVASDKVFGYKTRINTAVYGVESNSGKPGLIFDVQTEPDVLDLTIENVAGDGAFYNVHNQIAPGHLNTGFAPVNGVLSGKMQFKVSGILLLVHGNWQVSWQP